MALLALFALLGWAYLALFHGKFWKPLVFRSLADLAHWPSVTLIVPARNEAAILPQALGSLLAQDYPGDWRIVLVDDHSNDGTGAVAERLALERGLTDRLTVVKAPDLPAGWSGKVAAMQAGVAQSDRAAPPSDFILFTDADIAHTPNSLRRLVSRAVMGRLDLTSVMVKLNCVSLAEKFLIPAFVFFFAILYPFRRVNDAASRVAAAAGGVMLARRDALLRAGGLDAIKGALIDDCALARAIKDHGGAAGKPGRIQLSLARDVVSLRPYPNVADIHDMVARTAFTQLRYSLPLLLATTVGMALLFLAPPLLPLLGDFWAGWLSYGAWLTMFALYVPLVRFYGLSPVWALTLPLAAMLYLVATLDSARHYWRGAGGHWKGRVQAQG